MARTEYQRVRFLARGQHAKSCADVAEAFTFVASLDRKDFIAVTEITTKVVDVPGYDTDQADAKSWSVQYWGMGVRSKNFREAKLAAKFISKLPASYFLSITHVVEEEVDAPKVIDRVTSTARPALVLPTFAAPPAR